jgi:hypothetical protein
MTALIAFYKLTQRPQAWPIQGGTRDPLINEHMALWHCVPFMVSQLLAALNLGGNGKAFALVFRGHPGVDDSVSDIR